VQLLIVGRCAAQWRSAQASGAASRVVSPCAKYRKIKGSVADTWLHVVVDRETTEKQQNFIKTCDTFL
jgi:hypothetical protein